MRSNTVTSRKQKHLCGVPEGIKIVTPGHMGDTGFKRQKRKAFKEFLRHLDCVQVGCANLPDEAYVLLAVAFSNIRQAKEILNPWWKGC